MFKYSLPISTREFARLVSLLVCDVELAVLALPPESVHTLTYMYISALSSCRVFHACICLILLSYPSLISFWWS
jgi:hypothetical protein